MREPCIAFRPIWQVNEVEADVMQERDTSTTDTYADILARISDQLQTGGPVDVQTILKAHPEHAQQLEQILPAMGALELLGQGSNDADLTTTDSSTDPPRILGDFRILRELGRGGMGVVYDADQISMNRKVALKVLPFAALLDERQLQRFKNEARAAGALHHPNIVPVFSVGTERGVHYYAMQYIEGPSLAEMLRDLESDASGAQGQSPPSNTWPGQEGMVGRKSQITPEPDVAESINKRTTSETRREIQAVLSTQRTSARSDYFRSVANWGKQAAEALAYAHENGVLHRDIKPANLLLDGNGKVWVTDFGLARLESDASMTMTGDMIGTLRYMAPEQAIGNRVLVDQRADIYSLGVTLYELVTTQPAFAGVDRHEVLRKIAVEEPVAPRRIDATIPADLETIILKAAAKAPEDRYASAADLGDDLDRFLASKTISARPPTLTDRTRKWLRRHPQVTLVAFGMLLLTVLGTIAGSIVVRREQQRTREQRDQAVANLQLAMSALNDVYHEIGTNWIAETRELKDTQLRFMRRSSRLLNELASRFPAEEGYFDEAGLANLYAASMYERSYRFQEAHSGYVRACQFFEKSISTGNDEKQDLRSALFTAHIGRARCLASQWQLDGARDAYESAASLVVEADSSAAASRRIWIQTELLRLDSLELDHERVIAQATLLTPEIQRRILNHKKYQPTLWSLLAVAHAGSLREQGKVKEAAQVCADALKTLERSVQVAPDDRSQIRAIASLKCELGKCHLHKDEYDLAQMRFESAMQDVRSTFLFDGTPKDFSMAYLGRKVTGDMMEPAAFAQYAHAQRYLARVLHAKGEIDKGRRHADESFRSSLTLVGLIPAVPQLLADAAEGAMVLLEFDAPYTAAQQIRRVTLLIEQCRRSRESIPAKYDRTFTQFFLRAGRSGESEHNEPMQDEQLPMNASDNLAQP